MVHGNHALYGRLSLRIIQGKVAAIVGGSIRPAVVSHLETVQSQGEREGTDALSAAGLFQVVADRNSFAQMDNSPTCREGSEQSAKQDDYQRQMQEQTVHPVAFVAEKAEHAGECQYAPKQGKPPRTVEMFQNEGSAPALFDKSNDAQQEDEQVQEEEGYAFHTGSGQEVI